MMRIDPQLLEEVLNHLIRSGEVRFENELRNALKNAERSDVVELYVFLKKYGQRFESEWRDDFLTIFPSAGAYLPPVDDVEATLDLLIELIERGELDEIREFLGKIGVLNIKFDPEEAFQDGADVGFNEIPSFRPFELYPLDAESADGFKPVDYAESRGRTEIASYLRKVTEQVDEKWKAAYRMGWDISLKKVVFELVFTSDNEILHAGDVVSMDQAISLARSVNAVKLRGFVSVKTDPQVVASCVSAFASAGISDHEISFVHEG